MVGFWMFSELCEGRGEPKGRDKEDVSNEIAGRCCISFFSGNRQTFLTRIKVRGFPERFLFGFVSSFFTQGICTDQ